MLLVLVAIVVVAGIVIALFGWDRYRGSREPAVDGSAQPTAEVFVDPETGRRMRVWYDSDTGRREYRLEQPADAALGAAVLAARPGTGQADRERDAHPVRGGDQPAAPGVRQVGPRVPPPTGGGGDATIKVTGLTKRYGETVAVEGLSFSVAAGRVVGFLGPNGAGKTTTMRALLGLVRPTAGSATIQGRDYAELEHPAQTVGALLDGDDVHPGRSGRNHLRVLGRGGGGGGAWGHGLP
jgi:hypothetical protein